MKLLLVIVDLKLNIPMKWVWKCSKKQIQNNHFEMDDPVSLRHACTSVIVCSLSYIHVMYSFEKRQVIEFISMLLTQFSGNMMRERTTCEDMNSKNSILKKSKYNIYSIHFPEKDQAQCNIIKYEIGGHYPTPSQHSLQNIVLILHRKWLRHSRFSEIRGKK